MDLLDEIKERITIEDILAEQGIYLRKGRCCCPLHGGDNPSSFSVRNGVFHCFACGDSGDVISLVQKLNGMDFREAVRYLERKAGIPEDENQHIITKSKKTRVTHAKTESGKEDEDEILDLLIRLWEKVLKRLNEDLKKGRINLPQYYAQQQLAEYRLSILDEMSIYENYYKNRRKKDGQKTNESESSRGIWNVGEGRTDTRRNGKA
jgi:superfamily II DNA/RNA helicase